MKPLRVLHIIESLARGGAERQLVNQVLAHDRSAIHPSVVALNPPLDLAAELRAAGIAVMTLNLPTFHDMAAAAFRLSGIIKTLRPNIVHTWLSRADFCGRVAAVLNQRIPVISSIQAPIYDPTMYLDNPAQKRWKLAIVRQMDRWSGRMAQATYVGCSQDVVRSTGAALAIPEQRLHMIYNSVNPGPARAEQIDKRIIAVGRLIAQKGHPYLIEAMPAVLARHPDATLDVVGDGPLRGELERQTERLGIGHAVRFLGIRSDIPALLGRSAIFAFPSLWEGLPLALLEALGHSMPVVATDISPIREIIEAGVHGVLVRPQSPPALAEALIALIDNPEQQRIFGVAGYQRVNERFNINATVREWEQLYHKVALR
jgi:glycosyltransferase involved in cell wall biosynthesis